MAEQEPSMIIDDGADEIQRQALDRFTEAAAGFSEEELLSALVFVQGYNKPEIVLPLTKDPAKTRELFDSWRAVLDSDAYLLASFPGLEEQISQDPRFKELINRRERTGSQVEATEIKWSIVRLRFAIFGGRLAVSSLSSETGINEQLVS